VGFGLVDDPLYGVDGAKQAADLLREHLQTLALTEIGLSGEFQQAAVAAREDILQFAQASVEAGKSRSAAAWKPAAFEQFAHAVAKYGKLCIQQICHRVAGNVFRTIDSRVTQLSDELQAFWKDLNLLSEEFCGGNAGHVSNPQESSATEQFVKRRICAQTSTMLEQLEGDVLEMTAPGQRNLQQFIASQVDLRQLLTAKLRQAARRIVMRAVRDVNAEWIDGLARGEHVEGRSALAEMLSMAAKAQNLGGVERQLLIVPQNVDADQVLAHLSREGARPCVVRAHTTSAIACVESGQIPLATVANRIIGNQPLFKEIAQRLHSRSDIDWNIARLGPSACVANVQPAVTQECVV
jgi:hypothetical protein